MEFDGLVGNNRVTAEFGRPFFSLIIYQYCFPVMLKLCIYQENSVLCTKPEEIKMIFLKKSMLSYSYY